MGLDVGAWWWGAGQVAGGRCLGIRLLYCVILIVTSDVSQAFQEDVAT